MSFYCRVDLIKLLYFLLILTFIFCSFQVGLDRPTTQVYRNLLIQLPEGHKVIKLAYAAISRVVQQVTKYVKEWLQYQALWDLQPDHLYGQLGDDVAK